MMSSVIERRVSPLRGLGRPVAHAAPAVIAALVLTACGLGGEPDAAASPATRATDAAAPTTTTAPTARPASTTAATPTPTPTATTAPTSTLPAIGSTTLFPTSTTTAVPDTGPIDPPLDAYASEPVIEMGTISIPKIGVSMTMYEGIRLTTLDHGPGHWPGSALPGGAGNVVVGGHRSSKHQVFRHVDQLVAGDEIVFDDANGRHVYRVDRVEIVEPTAVWIVEPTETPTATLFACHPPGSTRQRIVVFADLVTG